MNFTQCNHAYTQAHTYKSKDLRVVFFVVKSVVFLTSYMYIVVI